nr:MAG TPA: hypothetical protein [Microviridae sp.]
MCFFDSNICVFCFTLHVTYVCFYLISFYEKNS